MGGRFIFDPVPAEAAKQTALLPLAGAAVSARLFSNTQFVYELDLAMREADALAGECAVAEGFRSLLLSDPAGIAPLLARAAYIGEAQGAESVYRRLTRFNVTRSMNQYVTHWFYPYKGKFHPQMVRALANIIGLRAGDVLVDPFSGSGTSAVEGALLGLQTVCFDISPLCALIGKVKANALHHLSAIDAGRWEENNTANRVEDIPVAEALAKPAAGFELLARLISLSDQARRGRDYSQRLLESRKKMRDSVVLMKTGCAETDVSPVPATVEVADARRLPLSDASADGVITSPPYSIALNYVANDAHALSALGIELEQAENDFIGVRGRGNSRLSYYDEDMRQAYGEIARILKPGAQAAIVLGNVTMNGREVNTVGRCEEICAELGLHLRRKVNKIIFGLYNVMQQETILIFRKESGKRRVTLVGGEHCR